MTHEINIADFAAFCRSKGEERYDFWDCDRCALAQYGQHLYPDAEYVNGGATIIDGKDRDGQVIEMENRRLGDIVGVGDWTFFALADRLEALMETADA